MATVLRNSRGGIDKPKNPLQTSAKKTTTSSSGGGGTSPSLTTMSVANSPTPTPYTTSPELTAMSIANSPTVNRNSRGGIDKPNNPLQRSTNRPITTPTAPTPRTAADFEQDLGRSAQKEITSLNKYAKESLDALQPRQDERLAETSSVNTLTGLAGSTEANRMTEKTTAVNQKEDDLVRAETAAKVQQILSNVRSQALDLEQSERTNARLDSAEARTAKAASMAEAVTNVTTLSQAGVNADAFKTQDPEAYNKMAEQVGGEEMLKAMFTLNRPVEQVLDKRIEGGKYVIAYQNPIDGKVRIESVDLGLPVGYSKTIDAGNRILAIPDDWDGDPSKLVTINKGLTPSQSAIGGGSSTGGIYDVLDFRSANAVVAQADKFNTSDIVKRLNASQQAFNSVQSIDPTTQNPADHQALIYDFAKALDPESVVREGEYETIKKYSQNLINKYKGEIENAINGTGFLSEEAIANIKQTIDNRYQSQLKQYNNKASETARIINTIAGKDVAGMVLQDYSTGAIGSEQSSGEIEVRAIDGTIGTIPAEQLEEALNAGYTQV